MSYRCHDTQGNIVRGYRHMPNADYLFYRVSSVRRVRTLLRNLLPSSNAPAEHLRVHTDEDWKQPVHLALNVAFTFRGLARLGWDSYFESFEDFKEGMYARAESRLGDVNREEWPAELQEGADLLFTIYFKDEGDEKPALELRRLFEGSGLSKVSYQSARAIKGAKEGAREHFGFRDGFSQPVFNTGRGHKDGVVGEGVLEPPLTPLERPRWRALRLGELLLGHPDEDGLIAGGNAPVLKNGTFMVWRKLEQHVNEFHDYFKSRAPHDEQQREFLKAKVVGRWQDGTSLVQAPYADPSYPQAAAQAGAAAAGPHNNGRPSNDFDYHADPDGAACPLGAHVRRANPRTGLKWWTVRTRRHRIVRRGMPYKEKSVNGAEPQRGLIFVCFNASIARQFELVQRHWLMDGDAFGLGTERDFMLAPHGDGEKMTIQGDRVHETLMLDLSPGGKDGELRQFVTVLGGYYLFVPGIAALGLIARGPAAKRPWLKSLLRP